MPRRRAARSARATRPARSRRGRRGRWPISWQPVCRARSRRNGRRSSQKLARLDARARRPAPPRAWKATISPSPCTESTACAFRSPDASRAREPSRSMRARPSTGQRAPRPRGTAASTRASGGTGQAEDDDQHAGGISTATRAGVDRVGEEVLDQLDVVGGHADEIARCAGARDRRAPARRASGTAPCRMSASSRYATSWASQDSAQCRSPASGATTASASEQTCRRARRAAPRAPPARPARRRR